jgi:hypothetical protein
MKINQDLWLKPESEFVLILQISIDSDRGEKIEGFIPLIPFIPVRVPLHCICRLVLIRGIRVQSGSCILEVS